MQTFPLDDRGSFAWLAGDRLDRASCALALDAGCLVVDPVSVPGLGGLLEPLGPVLGVATLFDRHARDSAPLAERHGAPRLMPVALGGDGIALDGVEERTVATRRGWREALLWLPEPRLLVCTETLGTGRFYLARPDDPLGIHPFQRLHVGPDTFGGLEPAAIAVGHGPPLLEDATAALRRALASARRDMPRAWLRAASAALGAVAQSRKST